MQAARTEGHRVSPLASGTAGSSLLAELGEERIARELHPEGRLGAVAGMDDGLGRQPVGEHTDGVEERVPVDTGQVDPADRAGEEEVAAEELAVGVIRDMRGR